MLNRKIAVLFFFAFFPILASAQSNADAESAPPATSESLAVDQQEPWLRALMPEAMKSEILFLEQWQWLAIAALVIIAWFLQKIVAHLAASILKGIIFRVSDSSRTKEVVVSIGKSIGWFASAAVVLITGPWMELGETGSKVLSVIARALASIGGLLLAYRLSDLVGARLEDSASKTESKLDDQLAPMIRKSLKVFVTIGACLFLIQSTGKDIMPLVTGLSVLGVGVSFAAKDTFANLFGSLTVFADRPFQLGDWVKVGGVEGTVEEIGFRCTRIRTFESSLVSVPNLELVSGVIDNMGQRKWRRFKTTIGVRYETPAETIEAFCAGILQIVHANPNIEDESAKANLVNFGASSLDIMVNIRFKVEDAFGELRTKQAFLLEVIRLAENMNVGFAFPSTSLYVESTPEHPYAASGTNDPELLKKDIERFGPSGDLSRTSGTGVFPDTR